MSPTAKVPQLIIAVVLSATLAGAAGVWLGEKTAKTWQVKQTQNLTVNESSDVINVVSKVNPSVVSIVSQTTSIDFFGRPQSQQAAGTGFAVTDALVMTNKHVASDSTLSYKVFTQSGQQLTGKLVATDPVNDIAILSVSGAHFTPLTLGDSSGIQVGEHVVAFGNALGQYQNSVTSGIISGIGRAINAQGENGVEQLDGVIQTDAAINPGNSGGPLVDLSGSVIGINTAVDQSGQLIGFALPINIGKSALKSYQDSGKIVRPKLGIRYVSITKAVQAQYGLSVDSGAYLIGDDSGNPAVVPGGPGDRAGLKAGDVITEVAGVKIDQTHGLTELIQEHAIGESVTLTVLRSGKTIKINVTLGSA